MSNSSIHDVANFIILEKNGLSHRALQKLLYYAQGFYLATYDEPLFDNTLEAWKFGPVNGSIWGRFKGVGYNYIEISDESSTATLTDAKKIFLSGLLAAFALIPEHTLIHMSHTDIPWEKNYIEGLNKLLPNEEIREYFKEFSDPVEYISIAKRKVEFSNLLEKRKSYLTTLPNIGDNWISGRGLAPAANVCLACKHFLGAFERNYYSKYANPHIPKVIMGPIPTGGVGIEIQLRSKNLFLDFHNSQQLEISIETAGKFEEYELTQSVFSEDIGTFLREVL